MAKSVSAFICLCFLIDLNLARHLLHPHRGLDNRPDFDENETIDTTGVTSHPPRVATEDELTKFLSLLNTSIAKQYSTGKNIDNAIVIDSLVSSRIDHAMLPQQFASVVEGFEIEFRGHYPKDPNKHLLCHAFFETVIPYRESSKIITAPSKFDCQKDESAVEATQAGTQMVSKSGSELKSNGKDGDERLNSVTPKPIKAATLTMTSKHDVGEGNKPSLTSEPKIMNKSDVAQWSEKAKNGKKPNN